MSRRLDEIDKRILYELAKDARKISAPQVAEEVDVSAATIRNRIQQLEEAGIIRGYHADIDFERCEGRMTDLFVCDAPIGDRDDLARQVLTIPGVVNVRELRTGRGNLQIKAVGEDMSDLTRIAQQLNKMGLEIEDEDLVQREYFAPYQPFGPGDGAQRGVMTDVVNLAGGATVVEVTVSEGAQIVNETLRGANEKDLLDDQLLIIAIEREDQIITPKGNTEIRAGDLVSVFSREGVSSGTLDIFSE
ncbi:AsnC family transcriptional regulator [Halobacteriales archaeon QS_4_62_28]|nr:MAG: AsnC family transcriptional regulator [Halobacteriales archaeon QS_4_62_28]